jgi:hypothetical protein
MPTMVTIKPRELIPSLCKKLPVEIKFLVLHAYNT